MVLSILIPVFTFMIGILVGFFLKGIKGKVKKDTLGKEDFDPEDILKQISRVCYQTNVSDPGKEMELKKLLIKAIVLGDRYLQKISEKLD